MKLTQLLGIAFISLLSQSAFATLTLWKSNDLMIVYGKAEPGDAEKFKEALSPGIKKLVLKNPTGMNFDLAREMAKTVEKAEITTVIHGGCTELVCPMLFLSGKQRQFSGARPLTAHSLTLGIGESSHVLSDSQTKISDIHSWWQRHTELTRDDLSIYRESAFAIIENRSKFDRKVFFPSGSGFSKGEVIHCSGTAKSQNLVDCHAVPGATALNKGIVTSNDLFIDERLYESADTVPPSPSGFAVLAGSLDVSSSDNCKTMYQDFLKQDKPRAFVVSNKQGCNWASLGFRPNERAMQNCLKEPLSGKECRFYAVDDAVVFTPFGTPLPATSGKQSGTENAPVSLFNAGNTTLLLARSASKEDGPSGVGDQFSIEGKILAYLTFRTSGLSTDGTAQKIEARWFNGSKLIGSSSQDVSVTGSTHHAWLPVLAADVGTGNARVEIYAGGQLIASKNFRIQEKL